jgi:hypothetical protein
MCAAANAALLAQALFGDLLEDTKLAAEAKVQGPLLKAAGAEPALQLAQLVALEHLLGVTLQERTKEVGCLSCYEVCTGFDHEWALSV